MHGAKNTRKLFVCITNSWSAAAHNGVKRKAPQCTCMLGPVFAWCRQRAAPATDGTQKRPGRGRWCHQPKPH